MKFYVIFILPILFLSISYLIGNLYPQNKTRKDLFSCFLYGIVMIFSVFEIIAVPMIYFRCSFLSLVIVMSIIYLILIYFGMKKIEIKKISFSKIEIAYLCGLVFVSLLVLYFMIFYQHVDEDDSRFIVEAVDAIRTNKMLLTNPATGQDIIGFVLDDSAKDLCSPYPIFLAYLSKIFFVSPVVMAHTVFPIVGLVFAIFTWWNLFGSLFKKDIISQSQFVIVLLLIALFGYSSLWTSTTMLIDRLWQGKSFVASIGIPLLFYALFEYYEREEDIFLVVLVNLSFCLLSGNGIVIAAIILGCFSLGYSIIKKNVKIGFSLLLVTLINAFLYLVEMGI